MRCQSTYTTVRALRVRGGGSRADRRNRTRSRPRPHAQTPSRRRGRRCRSRPLRLRRAVLSPWCVPIRPRERALRERIRSARARALALWDRAPASAPAPQARAHPRPAPAPTPCLPRAPQAQEDSEEHEPCSICLAVYLAGEELRELPCGHRFHAACIDCWLLSKCGDCSSADLPCCPLCKDVPLMLARAIEQRDLDAQRPQAAAPESTGPRDYSLEQIVARLWHRLCRARPLAVASSYLASVLKRVLEWRPLLATGTVAAPPTAAPRPNRLTSLRPIPPFNAGGNLPPGFIVV